MSGRIADPVGGGNLRSGVVRGVPKKKGRYGYSHANNQKAQHIDDRFSDARYRSLPTRSRGPSPRSQSIVSQKRTTTSCASPRPRSSFWPMSSRLPSHRQRNRLLQYSFRPAAGSPTADGRRTLARLRPRRVKHHRSYPPSPRAADRPTEGRRWEISTSERRSPRSLASWSRP